MSSQLPGRNEPCPCGSGKKYKKCCGALSSPRSPQGGKKELDSAFVLYGQGNISAALSLAKSLSQQNPQLTEAYALRGMCNYALKNFSQARDDFVLADQLSRFIRNKNDVSRIKLSLSTLEHELGNPGRAESYAREAIGMGLNTAASHSALAIALAEQGKYRKSLSEFDVAVRLDPADALCQTNKGNAHLFLYEYELAMNCYRNALDLDPELASALCGIGNIYLVRADYDNALRYFHPAENSGELDGSLACSIGTANLNIGRYQEAQQYMEKSIELEPGNANFYLSLGQLYLEKNKPDKSSALFEKALAMETENEVFLLNLAEISEKINDLKTAKELVKKLLTPGRSIDHQNLVKVEILQSRILFREGDKQRALEILKNSRSHAENNPTLYYKLLFELGYQLDKSTQYDEAFLAYKQANLIKKKVWGMDFSIEHHRKDHEIFQKIFSEDLISNFRSQVKKDTEKPQPIFIVGYPRSGTTLLEQILGSHTDIDSGGELEALTHAQYLLPEILHSHVGFPEILLDLPNVNANQIEVIRNTYYSHVQNQIGLNRDKKWFTDKMPKNLQYIGFISCIFPDSPIIHIRRHPLSSCLSAFMTDFSNRQEFSSELNSAAEWYLEQMNLVEYFKDNLQMKYFEVRYEDIVQDSETSIRQVLEFIGVDWNPACLQFYKSGRVARTASYEQVTRNIYSDSLTRHEHYSKYLGEAEKILEPVIQGYQYKN